MKCEICGEDMVWDGMQFETLVGYGSPPGHDHDNNCQTRRYYCGNGHVHVVSRRRRCPNPECDWKGKEECFCHKGKKVDEWPQ